MGITRAGVLASLIVTLGVGATATSFQGKEGKSPLDELPP